MKYTLQLTSLLCLLPITHSSIAQIYSDGYVYDTQAVVVRDGYNNCVRTGRWNPANAVVECDPDLFRQASMQAIAVPPAIKSVAESTSAVMPEGHPSVSANTMPNGHPSVETPDVPDASAIDLPNEGKVADFKDVSGYTYIEVTFKDKTRWLAAPRTPIAKGAVIRYGKGSMMRDFFSKSMNRNFPEIIFLDRVVVVSSGDKR